MLDILVVEPFSGNISGAQKVTLNIIEMFNEKYSVGVISRKKEGKLKKRLDKYDVIGQLPFENIISAVFGLGNIVQRNKSFFFYFKMLFVIFTCNMYCLYKAIYHRPKYIYTYDPRGLILSCLFMRLFGFKVIWHLHGKLNHSDKTIVFFKKLSSTILVPSYSIRNSFSDKSSINVIYNGFDFSNNISNRKFCHEGVLNITFIGTLIPHKGLHNVIDSMYLLINRRCVERIKLNVVGEYPKNHSVNYKKYLEDLVINLPKSVSVQFCGWSDSPEKYILDSDIVVFPSVIEGTIHLDGIDHKIASSEALPTVLIEALSCGVPVVATKTPGCEEIVSDKSYGVIIDESEPLLIMEGIETILFNSTFYKFSPANIRVKFSKNSMLMNVFHIINK